VAKTFKIRSRAIEFRGCTGQRIRNPKDHFGHRVQGALASHFSGNTRYLMKSATYAERGHTYDVRVDPRPGSYGFTMLPISQHNRV